MGMPVCRMVTYYLGVSSWIHLQKESKDITAQQGLLCSLNLG